MYSEHNRLLNYGHKFLESIYQLLGADITFSHSFCILTDVLTASLKGISWQSAKTHLGMGSLSYLTVKQQFASIFSKLSLNFPIGVALNKEGKMYLKSRVKVPDIHSIYEAGPKRSDCLSMEHYLAVKYGDIEVLLYHEDMRYVRGLLFENSRKEKHGKGFWNTVI